MTGLIDSASNGATEIPGTSADATFVFLAGPIRCWWAPGAWGSPEHAEYTRFRDYVHDRLSADYLVYAPHRAWRGPWNELAQDINDAAIRQCHALVWLNTPHVAEGTRQEVALARAAGIPTFPVAVGNTGMSDLALAMLQLRSVHDRRMLGR